MDETVRDIDIAPLLAPRLDAPILFPAYLDAWAQTNPAPVPSPDVSLFLHGPQRGEPDVNVCWREDLDPEQPDNWPAIVSLCPPSTPECMPVPIGVVRRWLSEREAAADLDNDRSDFLDGRTPESDDDRAAVFRKALVWRGAERSTVLEKPSDLKPGDTIVLPVVAGGWDVFGHIPDDSPIDIAEAAYRQSRNRVIFRLRPEHLEDWPDDEQVDALREWLTNPDSDLKRRDLRAALRRTAELAPEGGDFLRESLELLAEEKLGLEVERYPDGKGVVLTNRRRLQPTLGIPAMDDGEDERSRTTRRTPVPLAEHLEHVRNEVARAVQGLPPVVESDLIQAAARLHDIGKADERFQALLVNGDRDDAWAQPVLWAKSARMPSSRQARQAARERSGLPTGFRHEMLSVQLAERIPAMLPNDPFQRDLLLHLIAAHHGHARPFAPVVLDEEPPTVELPFADLSATITGEERRSHPPHRLDSGIAERFWKLTRRFGWWGLAYLEAILRLADQQASAKEDRESYRERTHVENESILETAT